MLVPEDFRPLFPATVAALLLAGGQLFAVGTALGGGSPAGVVVSVVAAALAALVVVARASAAEGASRRVAEGAAVGLAVWLVLELATAERLDGFGLDHAAGLGVGAAVALAARSPLRVAARLTAAAAVLGAALELYERGTIPDVGLHLPVAVVPAVVLADGAADLLSRGRFAAALLIAVLPVAAVAAGMAIENREDEQARRAAIQASEPPPARVGQERIAWTFSAPEFYTGPLVAGDVVIADARNGVWGLDARTGAERWHARVPGRDGVPEPIVDRDLLVYPANLAGIFAIDVETGRTRWRFSRPEMQFWGAARAGEIIVAGSWGTSGPQLSGHRRSDGRLLWTQPVEGDRFELTDGEEGVRFESDRGGWLVDPATGRMSGAAAAPEAEYAYGDFSALRSRRHGWKYRAGWDASTSEPVDVDGVVYVNIVLDPPKVNGGLYALDAKTGKLRWRVEITGDAHHRPAVRGPLVYVTSRGTSLHAIRR